MFCKSCVKDLISLTEPLLLQREYSLVVQITSSVNFLFEDVAKFKALTFLLFSLFSIYFLYFFFSPPPDFHTSWSEREPVWQETKTDTLSLHASEWKVLQIFCTESFFWQRHWQCWLCIFAGLSRRQREKEITSSTDHFFSVWEILCKRSEPQSHILVLFLLIDMIFFVFHMSFLLQKKSKWKYYFRNG